MLVMPRALISSRAAAMASLFCARVSGGMRPITTFGRGELPQDAGELTRRRVLLYAAPDGCGPCRDPIPASSRALLFTHTVCTEKSVERDRVVR